MATIATTQKSMALVALLCLSACGDALDTTRPLQTTSSLGATLYEEVCHRVAHAENPKDVSGHLTAETCRTGAIAPSTAGPGLLALTTQRTRFIDAVDTAIDPEMTQDLRHLLVGMLPLYDDGTMQAHMASVRQAIASVSQTPEAVAALGRMAARRGYVQTRADFAQAWMSYDGLDALTRTLLATPAAQRTDDWHLLQESLSDALAQDPTSFLADSADDRSALSTFLLSAMPTPSSAPTPPRWVVRRDARGMAMASVEGTLLKAPFIDADGDGLADVDAQGRYIGRDGAPLKNLPTPFPIAKHRDWVRRTPHARALHADGALWYQYRDAAPTVLAAVLEQGRILLDSAPDAALSGAQALQASAGARCARTYTRADGSQVGYAGYDADASPYIDIAQGICSLRQGHALAQATAHMHALWRDAEPAWAGLAGAALAVDGWQRDDAALYAKRLEAHKPLADDLIDVARQMAAEPGLIQDLMAAFAHPTTASLGARLAEQMRYTDRIDFDTVDVNAEAVGDFLTPVDRRMPDIEGNKSIFERLLHLVHDASGQRIQSNAVEEPFPVYARGELFEIEDAAVFYVRAMAGTATLTMRLRDDDEYFPQALLEAAEEQPGLSELEAFTGINGFEKIANPPGSPAQYLTFRATPAAAARLLFSMYDERVDPNSLYGATRAAAQMLTPRLRIDGVPFDVLHEATLFAWEKHNFFESMQPILQAFSQHGREDLLTHLVSVLHMHWQSPQSSATQQRDADLHSYAYQTGLSRLEPVFARLLDEQQLMARLGALVQASFDVAGDDVASGPGATAALIAHALQPSHLSSAPMRTGAARTSMGAQLTPAHLLVRGLVDVAANLDAFLSADSPARALSRKALHQAFDVEERAGSWRFKNRQAQILTGAWLTFAHGRMQAQSDMSDDVFARASISKLRDVLNAAPLQLGVSLAAAMADDPALAAHVGQLCQHLLGTRMDATLEATTDVLQILGDTNNLAPLLGQAATWLVPETGILSQSVHVLRALQDIDAAQTMPRLMQGMARDMGDETPLAALMDIFGRVNRCAPGDEESLAADDFAAMLGVIDHLIQSPEHGFARLVQLVEARHQASGESL